MSKTMTLPQQQQLSKPQEQRTLRAWLETDTVTAGIHSALAGAVDVDVFLAQMLISFQDPKIAPCTEQSKFEAIHTCAIYGLVPHLQQVALIPRKNKDKGLCCDVMVEWRGYKALLERHPAVDEVLCSLVHETDEFEFSFTSNSLHHEYDPLGSDRVFDKDLKSLRGGYLMVLFNDSRGVRYHFLNRDEILKRKRCAQTSVIWDVWPKEMAMKTVYRDGYSRQIVPMDPLCQGRMERVLSDEDESLGNDPLRDGVVPVTPRVETSSTPTDPAPLSRTRSEALAGRIQQPFAADQQPSPPVEYVESAKTAELETPEQAPEPEHPTESIDQPAPSTGPPDVPGSLRSYATDIHTIQSASGVAACWKYGIESNGSLSAEEFDAGTVLRDWALRKLGVEDIEKFMGDWNTKQKELFS